ncbi:MAG: hypothetical protein R2755_09755 [Acidimicrobiales bacterium]
MCCCWTNPPPVWATSVERLRASLRRLAATGIALVVATRNLAFARSLADHMLAVRDGRVQPFSLGEPAR